MVNGCFWHGHKGCRYATKSKTNVEFWETKIARNRHRDEVTEAHLQALGWHVITIWECELRGAASATSRLDALAEEIHKAGVTYLVTKLDTVTRTEVKVPINEIVSSHMARRTFIANIYNKVPDPNVVGSMTGHVEGSRAFARYRTIEEDVKKSLVDILG